MSTSDFSFQVLVEHPYYPQTLVFPNYKRGNLRVEQILMIVCSAVFVLVSLVMTIFRKRSIADRATILWFTLCFLVHSGFEGYYLANVNRIVENSTILSQIWGEYGLADSRYLTGDPTTLAMEIISVFVFGPLSLLAAYGIVRRRFATRHLAQLAVSIMHLYSLIIYFYTNILEDCKHTRPEPFYFWIYFVYFNFPWFIFPIILIIQSCREISTRTNLVANKQE
ncbi:hypothetical protein BB561_001083 [Smittium simulii]|uniref:EXPERA domain-containing protein n=1 Tax=Smittium simulii TaxID=133385 RepID=A0A2T9YW60_9FUNG|nr:hypothetical protein BB561_001083 [Smittium simulii]